MRDRLRASGFAVEPRVYRPAPRERERYGLDYRGAVPGFNEADAVWTITLCRRPAVASALG